MERQEIDFMNWYVEKIRLIQSGIMRAGLSLHRACLSGKQPASERTSHNISADYIFTP